MSLIIHLTRMTAHTVSHQFPKYLRAIAALMVALMTICLHAQEAGFLKRSVTLDGVAYPYQIYVSPDLKPGASPPVILALHGGGEYGDDGERQLKVGLAPTVKKHPERFPAIIVFPQAKADKTPGWQLAGGKAALLALDQTMQEFHGDPARVYLTGISAGGNGSWHIASQHPDRFAALVVVCGWITEIRGPTSGVLYPALGPAGAADPFAAVAKPIAALPIRMFHGDADKVIPVEESRKMVAALRQAGADVEYVELAGAGHFAWDIVYDRADLIEWMLKQRKAGG